MKRIIFILLITAGGIIASFFDAYWGLLVHTWYSFSSPLELTYGQLVGKRLSFIVGAVVVATTYHQRRRIYVRHRISALCFFLILQCCCSLAYSGMFSIGYILNEVELLAKIVLIAVLTPVLVDTLPRLRGYISVIAVSSGLLGAYYGLAGLFAGSRQIMGAGRIGDNNAYAVTLCSTLVFVFYGGRYLPLVIKPFYDGAIRPIFQNLLTAGVFVGNLCAVMITFSRGGFLAASVVLFAILCRLRDFSARLLGWGVLFPLTVVAVWQFFQLDPRVIAHTRGAPATGVVERVTEDYMRRIMTLRRGPQNEGSASSRLHFWKVALGMVRESPVFGVGMGRYRLEYDKFDFSKGTFGPARAVHNTYFSVMAELGIIGLMLYAGLMVSTVASAFRARRIASRMIVDADSAKELRDYADLTLIALLGFAVGSCFVTTFYQEMFWAIISIGAAVEISGEKLIRRETGNAA